MEKLKNKKVKLLFSFIIVSYIYILFCNVSAYQIKNIVRTKEELYSDSSDTMPSNYPTMVYKKQVSAYEGTITMYINGWNNMHYGQHNSNAYNVSSDGWVYGTVEPQDALKESNYVHDNPRSFNRVYEYFHKYQNSVYNTTNSSGNTTKHYSTGELWPQTYIIGINMIPEVVYDVTEETNNYGGMYWGRAYQGMDTAIAPYGASPILDSWHGSLLLDTITSRTDTPIVMLNSNLYRFAVTTSENTSNGVENVYVSDNRFEDSTIKKLWDVFGTSDGNKTLEVYGSSVLRTSEKNAKNGELYYKYMDTAFKFWESTVRGNPGTVKDLNNKNFRVRDWSSSPSITGENSVLTNGASSVINYYDNTFVIPKGNTKKVYVRHIDVTGLSEINSTTINNAPIITDINNGQLFELANTDKNGKLCFLNYKWPTSRYQTFETENDLYSSQKYNEMYELNADNKNWIIGNIKYSNSDSYVDSDGNSKTITYLNSEIGSYNTEKEQDVLNNYNCVGKIVGYGDSIDEAMEAKNYNLDTTTNLLDGDYANEYITGSGINDYIIVDFYYEKKPTDVYVRHINVNSISNISDNNLYGNIFIQTNKGKAFKLNKNDWNYYSSLVSAEYNIKPANSSVTYQEHYVKDAKDTLRIANIKYNHSTGGSYWNLLNSSQKSTYSNYYCIGAAVGKGSSADLAEVNKNAVKKEQLGEACNLTDFIKLSSSNTIKKDDRLIEKNDDLTAIVLNDNNYNVVVIDFYYATESPPRNNLRQVYVRHIDMTGEDKINYTTVQDAVSAGKVLPGNGTAKAFNSYYLYNINSNSVSKDGYKERYDVPYGYELEVSKYNSDDYNCVGSNITGSLVNYSGAKNEMDSRLRNGLTLTSSNDKQFIRTNKTSSDNVVILIDFYYKSKHTGTALTRPTKGRLSFYTLESMKNSYKQISGISSTSSNINNATTNDNANVIDVVPSGESLKASIDNAYTYMLGGINIKEQKIQDTYTFDYTITQKYTVNYLQWDSYCDGECKGHKDGIYTTNSCTTTIYESCDCPESCSGSGENRSCSKPHANHNHSCGGTWTAKATQKTTDGSITRTYRYQIPYEYTFYKVKNMRIYTISKMELLDDYSNIGLPLFDGKTHIINPKSNYVKSFNVDNSTFIISSSKQENNRTSKTLNTNLVYYYNNSTSNVSENTAKTTAIANINAMFDNVSHSMAASMNDFSVTGASYQTNLSNSTLQATTYTYNGVNTVSKNDRLRATFYVKNDEVSFKDVIKNSTVKLVGEGDDTWNKGIYKDGSSEKNAIRYVDLVEFTKNKTRNGSGTESSPYTYIVNTTTDTQKVSTQYPKSIRGKSSDAKGSKYLPTSNLTTKDYFEEVALNIPSTRLNGKRYSYGKLYYNLLENKNNKLNFDAKDNGVTTCNESNKSSCHDWNNDDNRTAVSGGGNSSFVDTEMYNTAGTATPITTTLISPTTLGEKIMTYGDNSNKNTTNKADVVDVFTPISFETWIVTGQTDADSKQVDHSTDNKNDTNVQIQKNTRFTIAMKPVSSNAEYSGVSTDKYMGQYYIKFNFDVQDVKIYDSGKSARNYDVGVITAGTWIGPIYHNVGKGEAKVSAFALADPNNADKNNVVNQETNSYTVRAVAYNAPDSLLYALARDTISKNLISTMLNMKEYRTYKAFESHNEFKLNAGKTHQTYYDQKNIDDHNNYVAETTVETQNLSRVYDFKVTDLKDLDWKDIFRTSTSTTTNIHTSKAYYSGIKKWNVYTTKTNERLVRDASEIGSTKQQILPLGPYKHTNGTYTEAPKLGYKFSFDLKTTGSLVDKKVIITPEFYYVSKEVSGNKPVTIEKNIDLYYKNSSNKYVSIDNYNLYFVPDDGYRLTFEGTDAAYRFSNSSLSKSTVKLGNTTKLTLTTKMMEEADSMFVQIWYGEYKLPNSTIAVKSGDNINNKLTNGYIGVKFKIEVEEYDEDGNKTRVLNYSKNDSNSTLTNTTQWDYEGYLGYNGDGEELGENNSKGEKVSARIALKGGSWILTQSDYEFVKGTVILYDTDAKASSDYN